MYIYQLLHKRLVEPPDIYSTKLIGFFDSIKNVQDTIEFYSTNLPGFKDYPKDFKINKEKLIDFKKIPQEEHVDQIYYAQYEEENAIEDYSIVTDIGIFYSKENAEGAIQLFKQKNTCPGEFTIACYEINKRNWEEGFFTYR